MLVKKEEAKTAVSVEQLCSDVVLFDIEHSQIDFKFLFVLLLHGWIQRGDRGSGPP